MELLATVDWLLSDERDLSAGENRDEGGSALLATLPSVANPEAVMSAPLHKKRPECRTGRPQCSGKQST
jgi:hypothetical protein